MIKNMIPGIDKKLLGKLNSKKTLSVGNGSSKIEFGSGSKKTGFKKKLMGGFAGQSKGGFGKNIKIRFGNGGSGEKKSRFSKNTIRYSILAVSVAVLLFAAYFGVRVRNIDFKNVGYTLSKSELTKDMIKGDTSSLRKNYGIDKMDVDDVIVYSPKTNMEANEILILKAKPGKVKECFEKVDARYNKQAKSFQNYSPEQYKIISNKILKSEGDNIIYIVSEKNNLIENIISNNYK